MASKTSSFPDSRGQAHNHNLGSAGRQVVCLLILAGFLHGCATTTQQASITRLDSAGEQARIVLMPLDVQLFLLTAGGVNEPQAEWTESAKQNMQTALQTLEGGRRLEFVNYVRPEDSSPDTSLLYELEKLHGAVGQAILFHKYQVALPTKKNVFDWTLGPEVRLIRERTNADYALFLYIRDSYSSAGRMFVQLAGAMLGVGVTGGQQLGFASLVDLKSGNIVWFNYLLSGTGDLRTPDPALKTVNNLLKNLPE